MQATVAFHPLQEYSTRAIRAISVRPICTTSTSTRPVPARRIIRNFSAKLANVSR
jgi:hypothetical protein